MEQGIRAVLRGVRPLDGVLAGALTALGVVLMVLNVGTPDAEVASAIAEGSMVHPLSTHTWLMVPGFVLATVPVLWWRRGVVEVLVATNLAMALHVLAFGWVTRCGAGLPLVLVLAYLGGRAERGLRVWMALGLSAVLTVLVVVRDATTGLEPVVLVVPLLVVVVLVGRAVRHKVALADELRLRTAELDRLREERAALVVADDRSRLSEELDGILQTRLGRLAEAAERGPSLEPEQARSLLEDIEADGRRTLEEMREVVGRLRGGEAALAPVPALAELQALLVQRCGPGARLSMTGDPVGLPPSVELSVYRIVEHLVEALTGRPGATVDVAVRVADGVVEVRVEGRAARAAVLRAAVARAGERARVAGGVVDLQLSRGRALAVAAVPVPFPDRG